MAADPSPVTSTGTTSAIAAPHQKATRAGEAALRDGGSAIDAAIAAAAVLTVVYPHNVALGGDLIALVRTPDSEIVCINASGWAPEAVDVDELRRRYGDTLPIRGAHTVTVPGGVRGWEALHRRAGRLDWHRLFEHAIGHARSGAPVAGSLARHLVDPGNADLRGTEDFDRTFAPGGEPLGLGDALRSPELADTLTAIAESGAQAFYTGPVADAMVDHLGAHGSALTTADFADFAVEECAPIATDFGDLTVVTSPPNTHGFILLRALRWIASADTQACADPLATGLGELIAEFADGNGLRASVLADPRHAPVDLDVLMRPRVPGTGLGGAIRPSRPLRLPHGDTVGVAAADSEGYAVSLIQSVYHSFGSGLIDPTTGVLFHNRGTAFALDPNSPNVIAPHKCPVHTLTPAMTITRDGRVRHVPATMGGQGQGQILGQILARVSAGETAASALAAPRAIVGAQTDGAGTDTIVVERDLAEAARAALEHTGAPILEVPPHTEDMGQANLVVIADDGSMTAATDPRADGEALVLNRVRV